MQFHSKLPKVGTTIFTTMSALANEHKAINLSQGFPDFPIDARLSELCFQYMQQGFNQYAPMIGALPLRQSIQEAYEARYAIQLDPDKEITITSGATEALFCAITAVVAKGDEVIIFEPAYDSYVPAIELNGAVAVPIPLSYPSYEIDWNLVKSKISSRTRAIILNSPHNPTGKVLKKKDMKALTELINGKNIFVISDEVYENVIFDGEQHESVFHYPELLQRSFVIFSFGKTFHITGWKLGFCIACSALTSEFRKIHQYVTFSSASPMQMAIAEYMKGHAFAEIASMYQRKRDLFLELTRSLPLQPLKSEGTYFQLMSYANLSDESDLDFAVRLTKEAKVACIPVSVFYGSRTDHKVLRFCFAKKEETLAEAAQRLNAYFR